MRPDVADSQNDKAFVNRKIAAFENKGTISLLLAITSVKFINTLDYFHGMCPFSAVFVTRKVLESRQFIIKRSTQ